MAVTVIDSSQLPPSPPASAAKPDIAKLNAETQQLIKDAAAGAKQAGALPKQPTREQCGDLADTFMSVYSRQSRLTMNNSLSSDLGIPTAPNVTKAQVADLNNSEDAMRAALKNKCKITYR